MRREMLLTAVLLSLTMSGFNSHALCAQETKKGQVEVGVPVYLENNGYLSEIYSVLPDLYLPDIFEAILVERPDIVANAVKAVRPSVKEVRVVRADGETLPPLALSEKELTEQGKVLVGIGVWQADATGRVKMKGYGGMPKAPRLDVTLQAPDEGSNWLSVGFHFAPTFTAAETTKIVQGVAETLAKELPQFSEKYVRAKINAKASPYRDRLDNARSERQNAFDHLAEYQGLPADKIAERLAQLDRQQLDVRLSLAGLEARENAVTLEIAKARNQQSREADNEVVQNMKEVFRLRSEQLDRLRKLFDSGKLSKEETEVAEVAMLEAKIAYEKARAAGQQSPAAHRIEALSEDLSRLATERAENNARLEFLDKARNEAQKELKERQLVEGKAEEYRWRIHREDDSIASVQSELNRFRIASDLVKPLKLTPPSDPFGK